MSEKVEYSDAYFFEYYVDLEDEWEYLDLNNLNLVEELLVILLSSSYECDVLYNAHSINKKIIGEYVNTLKVEYGKLYKIYS